MGKSGFDFGGHLLTWTSFLLCDSLIFCHCLCVVPWGSYFDHALGWEKKMDDPNVMVVTYEEMKQVKLHLT